MSCIGRLFQLLFYTTIIVNIPNQESMLQQKTISCFGTLQFQNKAFSIVQSCHKTFHPCYAVGDLKHVKSHYLLIAVWLMWNSKIEPIYSVNLTVIMNFLGFVLYSELQFSISRTKATSCAFNKTNALDTTFSNSNNVSK